MPQQYRDELPEADRQVLREAVQFYGLAGAPTDVAPLVVWGDRLLAAFTVGRRRLFLKEWCAFHETPEEIAFCLDIQTAAQAGGVPVAPVLAGPANCRVFVSAGRRFSLYEFVGAAYDPQRASAQLASTAQVLGAVHAATSRCDLGGEEWRDDPFRLSTQRLTATARALETARLTSVEGADLTAAIRQLTELLEAARTRCLESGWSDLPTQPIHGDFCQFNCRFQGDTVAAVVDWDHARRGRRLVDLAHALNVGLGWDHALDYYEDFTWTQVARLEPDHVARWLCQYRLTGPALRAQEAHLLPWLCVALWPWNVAGFCPLASDAFCAPDAVVEYAAHLARASQEFAEAAMVAVR